ncbi:effector-associated domain EAD1-containing protein [Frankia canadensis]|nr:effector-associated domain EAD1-containing protein [Frankia canadensis]
MVRLDDAMVLGMNGAQRRAVREALVVAYPSRGRLEALLDGLDRSLAHYAADQLPLPDAVFAVMAGAKAEGWLPLLLAEAVAVTPDNRQLADVVGDFQVGDFQVGAATTGRAPTTPPSDWAVIGALADEFPDLPAARPLISQAGLPPGRQPAWNVADAETFWSEVHRLLVDGAVVDGWPKVLLAAHRARPANPVLAAAVSAAGATGNPGWREISGRP